MKRKIEAGKTYPLVGDGVEPRPTVTFGEDLKGKLSRRVTCQDASWHTDRSWTYTDDGLWIESIPGINDHINVDWDVYEDQLKVESESVMADNNPFAKIALAEPKTITAFGEDIYLSDFSGVSEAVSELREVLDQLLAIAEKNKLRIQLGLNHPSLSVQMKQKPEDVVEPIKVTGTFEVK